VGGGGGGGGGEKGGYRPKFANLQISSNFTSFGTGKTEFICYVRLTCLKVKIMLYERATTVGVHAIRRCIEKLWLVAIATIFDKILKK